MKKKEKAYLTLDEEILTKYKKKNPRAKRIYLALEVDPDWFCELREPILKVAIYDMSGKLIKISRANRYCRKDLKRYVFPKKFRSCIEQDTGP